MNNLNLEELSKDETANRILNFIPNVLGINLCSVSGITIERAEDEQIKSINISFE